MNSQLMTAGLRTTPYTLFYMTLKRHIRSIDIYTFYEYFGQNNCFKLKIVTEK